MNLGSLWLTIVSLCMYVCCMNALTTGIIRVWKGRKMLDIIVLLQFYVVFMSFVFYSYLALWRQHNYECYDLWTTPVVTKLDYNNLSPSFKQSHIVALSCVVADKLTLLKNISEKTRWQIKIYSQNLHSVSFDVECKIANLWIYSNFILLN